MYLIRIVLINCFSVSSTSLHPSMFRSTQSRQNSPNISKSPHIYYKDSRRSKNMSSALSPPLPYHLHPSVFLISLCFLLRLLIFFHFICTFYPLFLFLSMLLSSFFHSPFFSLALALNFLCIFLSFLVRSLQCIRLSLDLFSLS